MYIHINIIDRGLYSEIYGAKFNFIKAWREYSIEISSINGVFCYGL